MIVRRRSGRGAVFGLVLVGSLAAAAPAHAPQLAVLTRIEPGQWQLKEPGVSTVTRTLCVSDPAVLLQLGHSGAQCSRFVIVDAPDSATVHYTCPGAGHGRTTIAIETPRLLRLQTQGIASGAPFDMDYEGRWIGDCGAKSVASH